MTSPIITLLTDFGWEDSYVAQMKGVILAKASLGCQLVDLSHSIQPQNVWQAAVFISEAVPRFPANTIHLVVVDPGVGSSRRIIAARILEQTLVLPDNGLLSPLLVTHQCTQLVQIEAKRVNPASISDTFHGRDIMAPAAAMLADGAALSDLGSSISSVEYLSKLTQTPPKRSDNRLEMSIFRTDHFGNVITNAPADWLAGSAQIEICVGSCPDGSVAQIVSNYANAAVGKLVALPSSDGLLELAVREGSAVKKLEISRSDILTARLMPPSPE